jgi:hypothetical protein
MKRAKGTVRSNRSATSRFLEAVDLLVGFAAALAEKDFGILERGSVDGDEAEGAEGGLELPHEGGPGGLGFRKVIPESLEDPGLDDVGHGISPPGSRPVPCREAEPLWKISPAIASLA